MTETGKIINGLGACLLLCAVALSPVNLTGQDLNLQATVSANPVFTGEQFTLTVEIEGGAARNVELPGIPEIPSLRILTPTPSRGQSLSIVNGETSWSTSYRYTLMARESGNVTIPAITIVIDGEEHQTDPIPLDVRDRTDLQSADGEQRPDIYTVVELDDDNPVVGQQVIASIVVYFREEVEVTSYQPTPSWRTDGFWKETLRNIDQPRAESEIIGNVRYRKAILLRYALFPTRSGTLTLSPFEMQLGIRTQQRRNDPFGSLFGGFGVNQQRVTIETETRDVNVRRIDPPANGHSISAVGDFDIERSLAVRQASVGTSVDLKTEITGEGNVPLVTRPDYRFPDSFEAYEPQESMQVNRDGTTVSGTKIFTDTFVPRTAGTYSIPEMQIAIYNPVAGRYTYQTLPELTLEVTRNPVTETADRGLEFTLEPVTGLAVWNNGRHGDVLSLPWFWTGLVLPVIGFIFALRVWHLRNRMQSDADFARSRRAWETAIKALESARQEARANNPKEVYNLLHKALTGFVSDRLSLPEAGLSDTDICRIVSEKTEDPAINRQLKQILDRCATISYAPSGSAEDILTDINRSENLLKQLRSLL